MANWTVAGLVANIVGTVLVGFVVPRHQMPTYGGGIKPIDWVGRWAWPTGWAFLVVGFVGQLAGALGW